MARAPRQRPHDRARAPRVQITYDTEVAGRLQHKELPFVLGVVGDYSVKPDPPLPRLRDRKFVDVEPENFDAVLKTMRPRLAFHVDNRLSDDDSKLAVELRFESLDDFEPEHVAMQVEPLRKLIELRQRLSSLRSTLRRNGGLGNRLQVIIEKTERQRAAQGTPPDEAEGSR